MGTKMFNLVTLTLVFDLIIENLDYIFLLVGTRALTFQKLDLVTLTLVFDLVIKNFNFGYIF
jgi:hypothetical protein